MTQKKIFYNPHLSKFIRILTPEDYTRKRIIGTEQEYGIWPEEFSFDKKGFIQNGGCIYRDGYHPEYASPEASNPLDAVKYSKAGEIIIKKNIKNSEKYDFFKHVFDGNEKYFGAHENYSITISQNRIAHRVLPFFTTRIIYAGAGTVTTDYDFEISQKAGSVTEGRGSTTTHDRAIINLKEENHSHKYSRLHIISGDANMSEVAEYLKLGTTALVLDLAEDEKIENYPVFQNSVSSFHKISKDLTLKERLKTDKGKMTAIEIQKYYQELAKATYQGRDKMTDDILNRWKFVLNTLETDPMQLDRGIDWVVKKKLIDSYMNKTGKSLDNPEVRNIDLMYHNTDKNKGLFYLLQNKGLVDRLLTDEQIEYAVENAPEDTRAYIRGKAVKIEEVYDDGSWRILYLERDHKIVDFDIDDPFDNYKHLEKKLKLKEVPQIEAPRIILPSPTKTFYHENGIKDWLESDFPNNLNSEEGRRILEQRADEIVLSINNYFTPRYMDISENAKYLSSDISAIRMAYEERDYARLGNALEDFKSSIEWM